MQFAQWDITSTCNMRCKHCRAWKLPRNNELSTKEGMRLLDQLYKLKVQILNLSGGEPLLRKDIFLLLDYAKKFNSVTITTNGLILNNENFVKKIKAYKNLRVSLSIDGMKKFHDEFRQIPGAFEKAITAVKILTKESIPTSIRFTLTKLNDKEALKVFKLTSRYRIESFNIRAVLPFGHANKSIMPSSEQYKKVLEKLLKESSQNKIPIISGDPILLPLFPELLGRVWQDMGQRVYSEIYGGCLAGDEIVYIKPNGDIGACAFIPDIAGNIRENSLIEVINKSPLFKKLHNCRDRIKGKCGACKFKYLCGGCRAAALATNRDLFAEDLRCLLINNKDTVK
ncbi:MAG: radical SAM protein [Patescibacteria group bacterium]